MQVKSKYYLIEYNRMYYILDKIGNYPNHQYKVISHHEDLTQDIIDKYSESSPLFNLTKFQQNRWCELWLESDNRVIVFFNDAIDYPKINTGQLLHLTITNEYLERVIKEYKTPLIRDKKLDTLGI